MDPGWLEPWCVRELGSAPAELLHAGEVMSEVLGVRLEDGRRAVVKARPDERGRAVTCLAAQRAVAGAGLPAPRPLTRVTLDGGTAVHAEEWWPGGELLRGHGRAAAEHSAALLARAVAVTAPLDLPPPLPNPLWVRWDEPLPAGGPDDVHAVTRRVRTRLARSSLPAILGHADWEAQNLRWNGTEPHAIHDWDSLAWLPEAALAGDAAGAFASAETPTLAPVGASEAFLAAYERARGRPFTGDEREVAWAASLWTPAHNARGEAMHGSPPVALTALREQAEERLSRAGA